MYRKIFGKMFCLRGHLSPKTSTVKGSNRHLTETGPGEALQRDAVQLHIELQGSRKFPDRSTSCMTYGFGATGHQSSPIFTFFLFLHTKCIKILFSVHGLQPAVTLQNVVLEGPKGCLLPVRQIPVYTHNATARRFRSAPKTTQMYHSQQRCVFWGCEQNVSLNFGSQNPKN